VLVRYLPELLQDNENHVMSDWGSSGRRFKSCQPDQKRPSELAFDFIRLHACSTAPKIVTSNWLVLPHACTNG
jgi:hypothetical protein